MDAAIHDGEAVAGDGHEGIQSVFAHRGPAGSAMAFVGFDVLRVGAHDVMREPWRDRRKRLEDVAASATLPGVAIVPTTDDAARLWDLWVIGGGGEGIVIKEPESRYHPGMRSPAWLKVKAKLTLSVTVTGGSAERIAWGDWGEAAHLTLEYLHPRTGLLKALKQAVRVPRGDGFGLRVGQKAEVLC